MKKRSIRQMIEAIFGMLAFQFVLGMALNLIGEPDKSTPAYLALLANGSFILHIITALGLLVSSILIYRKAKTDLDPKDLHVARWGVINVIIAIAGGSLTVSKLWGLEEVFSFVMAIGFILTLYTYIKLYTHVRVAPAKASA